MLGAKDWKHEHDVALFRVLKTRDPAGTKTGKQIKALCTAIRNFKSATLSSKPTTMRRKMKDPDYNPVTDGMPMHLAGGSGDGDGDEVDGDADGDFENDEDDNPKPVRAKLDSPKKPSRPDLNLYSKSSIKAAPFESTVRLHEMTRYQDSNGFNYVVVILRFITDHTFEFRVHTDGRHLSYTIKPKTTMASDFIDPTKRQITWPETAGLTQYFTGDENSEEFTYTITIPEGVDSNPVRERDIFRRVETVDVNGKEVVIMQKVGKAITYKVSGQRTTVRESDW